MLSLFSVSVINSQEGGKGTVTMCTLQYAVLVEPEHARINTAEGFARAGPLTNFAPPLAPFSPLMNASSILELN